MKPGMPWAYKNIVVDRQNKHLHSKAQHQKKEVIAPSKPQNHKANIYKLWDLRLILLIQCVWLWLTCSPISARTVFMFLKIWMSTILKAWEWLLLICWNKGDAPHFKPRRQLLMTSKVFWVILPMSWRRIPVHSQAVLWSGPTAKQFYDLVLAFLAISFSPHPL